MSIFSLQKFLVLKVDDIEKYLTEDEKNDLLNIAGKILHMRMKEGKKQNTYLVVNMDEPYALVVSELVSLGEAVKKLEIEKHEQKYRTNK